MKPLEELADEYVAEIRRIDEIIEKLKKKLKAELKKKKDSNDILVLRKKIIKYTKMRDEMTRTAYELINYYKPKNERQDLNIKKNKSKRKE